MLILSIGLIIGLVLGWLGLLALEGRQKHQLDKPNFGQNRRH